MITLSEAGIFHLKSFSDKEIRNNEKCQIISYLKEEIRVGELFL